MEKINTFVINPVLPNYIEKFLETLHEHTPENFQVIIVDQTKNGIYDLVKRFKPEVYLRSYRNLGFSKSMNMGGRLATTKYVTFANDDIEFLNKKWWSGIEETFAMDKRIIAVNPDSAKIAMWGYGLDHYTKYELLPQEQCHTDEGYEYLLKGDYSNHKDAMIKDRGVMVPMPKTFPFLQTGVVDGIATWCTTFDREKFWMLGGFDEKYYPGGGEDHDICARAYSKHYRMVGTSKSFVWHHWSSSRDHLDEVPEIQRELVWNNHDELWPPKWNGGQSMDPWAHWTDKDGNKHPMKRVAEVTITPL